MRAPLVISSALIGCLAGCANFQDPDIVIDLRVLSIVAQPADQVIDISTTSTQADVLAQLVPTTVCALTADPAENRQLRWKMTMCNLGDDDRCSDGSDGSDNSPQIPIGEGVMADPDTTSPEPQMCATIYPNQDLFDVLVNYVANDDLMGLGGIDYGMLLEVGGVNDSPADDQFAAKTLQVMPRIPSNVTVNHNPTISGLTAAVDGGSAAEISLIRCADLEAFGRTPQLQVTTDDVVRFTPLEPPGVHEVYVVPTINGGSQTFTEAISYQWNATQGSFSSGSTGGPVDLFGNPAPLFTDWTTPAPSDINNQVTNVPLWLVQRDDRLGEAWFESCIQVTPVSD